MAPTYAFSRWGGGRAPDSASHHSPATSAVTPKPHFCAGRLGGASLDETSGERGLACWGPLVTLGDLTSRVFCAGLRGSVGGKPGS